MKILNKFIEVQKLLLVGVLAILLSTFLLTGCSSNSSDSPNSPALTEPEMEVDPAYTAFDTPESIVKASELVVSGVVSDISKENINIAKDDAKPYVLPYIVYTINNPEIEKGEYSGDSIKIKELDFSGISHIKIETGKKYTMFLQTYEDAYPSLINETQSVYLDGDVTPVPEGEIAFENEEIEKALAEVE